MLLTIVIKVNQKFQYYLTKKKKIELGFPNHWPALGVPDKSIFFNSKNGRALLLTSFSGEKIR